MSNELMQLTADQFIGLTASMEFTSVSNDCADMGMAAYSKADGSTLAFMYTGRNGHKFEFSVNYLRFMLDNGNEPITNADIIGLVELQVEQLALDLATYREFRYVLGGNAKDKIKALALDLDRVSAALSNLKRQEKKDGPG